MTGGGKYPVTNFPRVAGFGSVRRGREACHDHGRTIATAAGKPCRA
jgi:hypothetical protein